MKNLVPTLSLSVGTHEISLGFQLSYGVQMPYANLALQNSTRYYFKAPGNEKRGFESRFEAAVNVGWTAQKDSLAHRFDNSPWYFNHQIGYAYVYYWDQFETTQSSGIFRIKVGTFHFQIENDFFVFKEEDRFRTGALYVAWQIKKHWFYIKNIGYTGNPYAKGIAIIKDENFPAKYGYTDMLKAPLGNKSMGVLSLGWSTVYKQQHVALEAGIDAEQIRNYFQNRLIHETKWLTNPHIPMVDSEGKPYLYLPNQFIRKAKPYLQIFINDFYLY